MALLDVIAEVMGQPANKMVGLPPLQGGFQDYGPWGAGGGPVGPGPFPASPRETGRLMPQMQIPQASRPFNPIMDPSRSGALGFIARMSGAPTREEAASSRAGEFSAAAFQTFQQLTQQGMPPQQAVMQLLASPEGQAWFANPGSDPNADVRSWLSMQPTPPADYTMNPGDVRVSGATNQPIASVPAVPSLHQVGNTIVEVDQGMGTVKEIYKGEEKAPQAVRQLTAYMDMANLSPADRQQTARKLLDAKTSGDPSQVEQATQEMLQLGLISNETRLKINAGALSFEPVLDADGKVIGHVLRDKTGPVGGLIPLGGVGAVDDQRLQSQSGDLPAAQGKSQGKRPQDYKAPEQRLAAMADPTDIVLGNNLFSKAADAFGDVAGLIDPRLSGGDSHAYNVAVDGVVQDLLAFRDDDQMTKDERQIAIGMIQSSRNPVQMAQTLIQVRQIMEDRRAMIMEKMGTSRSVDERQKLRDTANSIDYALRGIPSASALQERLERINNGEDPIATQYIEWLSTTGMGAAEDVGAQAGVTTPEMQGPPMSARPEQGIPPAHVQYLQQHPDTAAQFEQKYGAGSAAAILGTGTGSKARGGKRGKPAPTSSFPARPQGPVAPMPAQAAAPMQNMVRPEGPAGSMPAAPQSPILQQIMEDLMRPIGTTPNQPPSTLAPSIPQLPSLPQVITSGDQGLLSPISRTPGQDPSEFLPSMHNTGMDKLLAAIQAMTAGGVMGGGMQGTGPLVTEQPAPMTAPQQQFFTLQDVLEILQRFLPQQLSPRGGVRG